MRKNIFGCLLILLNANVFAWTLIYKGFEGYPKPQITINISNTSCSAAGLSSSELKGYIEDAIEMYWNSVPTSKIELKIGSVKSIDIDGDATVAAVAAKADSNTILIGCNDDVASFTDGFTGAVGGVSCSGTSCRGGVIVNAHANTKVDTYSKLELQSLLGHEIGHAIGLGHSSVEESLMYYSLSEKSQEQLHQDDMNGITWIYPNEDNLGGLAGSCGTITFDQGEKNLSFFAALMLMFVAFAAVELGRRLKLRVVANEK